MQKSSSLMAEVVDAYRNARFPVALTGAGISVESGIPDFRSPGGIWTRFSPEEYATLKAFEKDPAKAWHFFRALEDTLSGKGPNAAHKALVRPEQEGRLGGIITQNIDGLHEAAGSLDVLAIHGNHSRLYCIRCSFRCAAEASHMKGALPRCHRCGAVMKPDVVLFGEEVQERERTEELLEQCDMLCVIGTSAQVFPAAVFPRKVRRSGGKVIEFNLRGGTGDHAIYLTRGGCFVDADYFFEGRATLTVTRFVHEILSPSR